jgi:hypothetical protein
MPSTSEEEEEEEEEGEEDLFTADPFARPPDAQAGAAALLTAGGAAADAPSAIGLDLAPSLGPGTVSAPPPSAAAGGREALRARREALQEEAARRAEVQRRLEAEVAERQEEAERRQRRMEALQARSSKRMPKPAAGEGQSGGGGGGGGGSAAAAAAAGGGGTGLRRRPTYYSAQSPAVPDILAALTLDPWADLYAQEMAGDEGLPTGVLDPSGEEVPLVDLVSARAKAEAHVVRLCDDRRRRIVQGGGAAGAGDAVQGEIVLKGWHVCLGVDGWIGVDEEPSWVLVLTSTAFYKLRVSAHPSGARATAVARPPAVASPPACCAVASVTDTRSARPPARLAAWLARRSSTTTCRMWSSAAA